MNPAQPDHAHIGESLESEEADLHLQVAWACRILAMNGHGDFTLGHVSARGRGGEVHIKRRGLGLNEVSPQDILTINMEREVLAGEGEIHLETVLHTEVYRARPDVGAVAHTHPPFATALGATDVKLEILGHDAALFKDGLGIFDDTAELIMRPEQGRAVACALGGGRAVLLRNHGLLVVGKNVPWLVYTALTLERAVYIQTIAASLGHMHPMQAEMVERLQPEKFQDDLIHDYWRYLIREARRAGLADGMPDEA